LDKQVKTTTFFFGWGKIVVRKREAREEGNVRNNCVQQPARIFKAISKSFLLKRHVKEHSAENRFSSVARRGKQRKENVGNGEFVNDKKYAFELKGDRVTRELGGLKCE
jgi:hypothetical protein